MRGRLAIMRAMPNRWKPNVTAAAVIERDGHFLLIEEDTADGLRLNNPAGHLDPGESPVQACVREVLEETGYDITYMRFAFCGKAAAHHDWRSLDDGIVRAVWMTLDEIKSTADRHRSPFVIANIEDYLRGQRFPLEMVHTHESVFRSPFKTVG